MECYSLQKARTQKSTQLQSQLKSIYIVTVIMDTTDKSYFPSQILQMQKINEIFVVENMICQLYL